MDLKLSKFNYLCQTYRRTCTIGMSILDNIYIYIYVSTYTSSIYISSYKCRYANSNYPFCSYLDCLPCLEKRLVRIGHVFQRDPVELALVDVRYSVVLATLRCADRRLQMVFESVIRETVGQTNKISRNEAWT